MKLNGELMALETISVKYIKINTLGGVPFYHGTLVYTNSAGKQFFAGGAPQLLTPTERADPINVAKAELAVHIGGTDPYGNITQ
jgi:hypothetical protein